MDTIKCRYKTNKKERPINLSEIEVKGILDGRKTQIARLVNPQPQFVDDIRCYSWGYTGDLLLGRETFYDRGFHYGILYRASVENGSIWCVKKWNSPMVMKKFQTRIWLQITGIKVDRIKSITEEDAVKEGVTSRPNCWGYKQLENGWSMDWSKVGKKDKYGTNEILTEHDISLGSAQAAFANFWDLKYRKTDYSWDKNPWVRFIDFERLIK